MFVARLLPSHISRCSNRLNGLRFFTAFAPRAGNTNLPPRVQIKEEDIEENFIKGGGAGGQKINKTNSQETRSRSQNRTIARRILAERIEDMEKGDQSRSALKVQKAIKRKANAIKKRRRKYRKLDQEQSASDTLEDHGEDRPHDDK